MLAGRAQARGKRLTRVAEWRNGFDGGHSCSNGVCTESDMVYVPLALARHFLETRHVFHVAIRKHVPMIETERS